MSKGNLFLGFGRGSVGDVVFYRQEGEQIARARNRAPKNPQTALQLLQRVVMKTTSMGYSMFQDIANHSFQGFAEGTPCQAQFNKLNVQMFREQLADEINGGSSQLILTSASHNFSGNGASEVAMNPYIVSDGSMAKLLISWGASLSTPSFMINVDLGTDTPTYSTVIAALNLLSGDQLTFLSCSCDDTKDGGTFNAFEYCRVILEPASGDLSLPFLAGDGINDPNPKNEGDFVFMVQQSAGAYYLSFRPRVFTNAANGIYSVAASTVISSRFNGGIWARSKQQLVVRSSRANVGGHLAHDHGIAYLGDAVQSFLTGESSLLYLNQAGGGGQQGEVVDYAKFVGVTIGGRAMAKNQLTSVYANTGDLVAIMSGGDSEATYTLALIANGSSSPFKTAVFSGTSATIANVGIVKNTVYNVVLLEEGEAIDNFGTLRYIDEPQGASIVTCTFAGQSVQKNSDDFVNKTGVLAASIEDYEQGVTYQLQLRPRGTATVFATATFSAGSAATESLRLEIGTTYDIVLVTDGAVTETWASIQAEDDD